MGKMFKKLLTWLSLVILVVFLVVIVNQTIQIVRFTATIDPILSKVVLGLLVCFYMVCTAVPLTIIFRMPKPLTPPSAAEGPEFDRHLSRLRSRFASNPRLRSCDLSDRSGIEDAIAHLSREADVIATQNAKHVFIATAISQNGKMDGLVTLAVQTRMVWQIAHCYLQRPSLREMIRLYTNVAMTAFVAAELQDIDISTQMEPVVSSVVGYAASAIPGAQVAAYILINSSLTGAANAFLTLRVGMITKRYCGALVQEKRGFMRRSASAEAAALLSAVVADGMKKVAVAVAKAAGTKVMTPVANAFSQTLRTVAGLMKHRKGKAL